MSNSISIDISLECASCGTKLEGELKDRNRTPYDKYVDINPCPDCLKTAKDEGIEEGKAQ